MPVSNRPSAAQPADSVAEASAASEKNTNMSRHQQVSEAAYRRAESRGFAPGGEFEDWLLAEREVDAGRGASESGS